MDSDLLLFWQNQRDIITIIIIIVVYYELSKRNWT